MILRTYFYCPKCGTKNDIAINLRRDSIGDQIRYCDTEKGGCGELLILNIKINADLKISTPTEFLPSTPLRSPFTDFRGNVLYNGYYLVNKEGAQGKITYYRHHEEQEKRITDAWKVNYGAGEIYTLEEEIKKQSELFIPKDED